MSQKKQTPAILLSLLITALLAGLWWFSVWWFSQPSKDTQNPSNPASSSSALPNQPGVSRFEQVKNVPSGLFNYGGSTTWAPIRLTVDAELQQVQSNFRLRYVDPVGSAPGSGTGIKMLLDGQMTFAQSSRPLTDLEYQQARQRGFTLTQIPVAIDGIAFVVHPSLNLPGLTLTQLKDIYTGRVTNWQQVGGADLPIVVLSRDPNSGGTVELFLEQVLGGQSFAANVQIMPSTTEAVRKLAATPGGIYFGSAPEVVPQCSVKPIAIGRSADKLVSPYQGNLATQCPQQRNQLNETAFRGGEYPLTRDLFVVVKQNQGIEQQAGEAYANFLLSHQGQEGIAKAGFVRIR
jgi:phosphate transport system substrate-binding protein